MRYYIIDGPKVWDIERAVFVAEVPDGEMYQELYNGNDLMPLDMFRGWLTRGGYPLGELRPIEEARAAKLADVIQGYKAAFGPIEAAYPTEERETWPIQLEEARAYLADPSADTPMLSIMVAMRGKGESVGDFAGVVMANNAVYRLIAGYLTGQQQRMYAEVNALDTVEAVQAYQVAYTMPDGVSYAGM